MQISSAVNLNSSCRATLPQKFRRRCEASEKRSFSQEFLSHTLQRSQSVWHCPQIGVGRYGFCRTGVVMDWSNKSDEIYFNHFLLRQDNKNGVLPHAAPPHTQLVLIPHPPKNTKKKNSSSANTWVLVNKNPAPCYSPTVKFAVPSPLRSLTTVFGKGTCVTTSLWAPEKNQIKKILSIKSYIRTTCCDTFFTYTPEIENMRKKVVKPHDI